LTLTEFIKSSWKSGVVTGAIIAYLGLRVEPFKSHLVWAALAAIGVGALAGVIELGVRTIAERMRGR
jgi:hypothetical protein